MGSRRDVLQERALSEQEAISTAEYKQTQSGYTYRDYTMATSHKQFQSSA